MKTAGHRSKYHIAIELCPCVCCAAKKLESCTSTRITQNGKKVTFVIPVHASRRSDALAINEDLVTAWEYEFALQKDM